jgi:hypothetical protein
MKLALLVLVILTTGCAPRLGAHIHRFSHAGVTYYHCTVVADERDNHLADAALDICKNAIENPQPHEPYKK